MDINSNCDSTEAPTVHGAELGGLPVRQIAELMPDRGDGYVRIPKERWDLMGQENAKLKTRGDHWQAVSDTLEHENAKLRDLVKEVTAWHTTQDSGDYNGCDLEPCHWCELAHHILSNVTSDLSRHE